jgi:hypothetical protein
MMALSQPGEKVNSHTGERFNSGEPAYEAELTGEHLPKLDKRVKTIQNYNNIASKIRNWSLVLGLILLAVSKFIGAYVFCISA